MAIMKATANSAEKSSEPAETSFAQVQKPPSFYCVSFYLNKKDNEQTKFNAPLEADSKFVHGASGNLCVV
jgi:hypothetical protein